MKISTQRYQNGSALVLSVFVVFVVGLFIGMAFEYTSHTAITGNRERQAIAAQALAEGALEAAFKKWESYMVQSGGTILPAANLLIDTTTSGAPTPPITITHALSPPILSDQVRQTLNATPGAGPYTIQSLWVIPVDRQDNPITDCPSDGNLGGPNAATISNPSGGFPSTVNADTLNMLSIVPVPNQPGWTGRSYAYRATATVAANNPTGGAPITVTVSRYFQKSDSSLFQAMLFFQNDLELHPGPQMTLYGLIHTNSNLYAAAGTGGSLTFASNVSFTGVPANLTNASAADAPSTSTSGEEVYMSTGGPATPTLSGGALVYPSGSGTPTGYVQGVTATLANQENGTWSSFINPVFSTSMAAQLSQVSSMDPLGASAEQAYTGTPNANTTDGLHEIIDRPVPTSTTNPSPNPAVADPPAFAAHRLFNQSSIRILVNRNTPSQPVHVYVPTNAAAPDGNSTEVIPTGKPPTSSTSNIADKIISAITPSDGTGQIQDNREGGLVNLDTVDMSVLTPILNTYSGTAVGYNGIVYISDMTDANANGNTMSNGNGVYDAIRLKKGGVLPSTSTVNGLSIVSDGAIYVQGDYNTGATYGPDGANGAITLTSQPASNTAANPLQYTVPGYTQKPAAVIGDSVMILSNSWLDSNSKLSTGPAAAAPTTFNSAILSGQVLTTTSIASGGAHNFPRFLENWSGQNFTYYGSMCELYASTHFIGTYGKANVYSPPNRRWYFDNNLYSNPPPGAVTSTNYSRGRWVRY